MKKSLLMALVIASIAILVPAAVIAAPTTDVASGLTITSSSTSNTLNYKDNYGSTREEVTGTTVVTTVTNEFGFNPTIGSPADLNTTPGVKVTYTYTVTNEGNQTDTYALTIDDVTYSNASNWTVLVRDSGDVGTISTLNCLEDETKTFMVTVTPSTAAAQAPNASYANVRVKVATSSTPVGEYTGANGNKYGGTSEATDTTKTTIRMGVMTLTRTATVDAPNVYAAHTGAGAHDAVPGSIITYVLTYGNAGDDICQNVIIADKVPERATKTYALHINAVTTTDVTSINGGSHGTATGWTVFKSTDGGPNVKDWNADPSLWTQVGTLETGNETWNLGTDVTYVKWQKSSVASTEDNKTLTWGVVIQ